MSEFIKAKDARAMADLFRTNANIQKAIEQLQKEISLAVLNGCSETNSRIIAGLEQDSEQEFVISKLKDAGYRVTKIIHRGQEDAHEINWS